MISVMALMNRYYIYIILYKTNHIEQKQCCGGEINLQCTIFHVIFITHLPTDIITCLQECWFNLFLWNKYVTHNSMHIKTNINKHFTQEQTSLPTSGREIFVVICNDL